MDGPEQIRLQIPEEVERLLEERSIQKEEIRKVIHHAETTGDKFTSPSTGRSLACLRPVRVNYWVEYTPLDGAYLIHTAYSHRMELKRGGGA